MGWRGFRQLLLTRKGSGDCILSQDQGEEKKKIRAESLQAFEMFQSKENAVESSSGNIFGVPLHPGLWMWSLPVALGGEQGEEGR